MATLPLPRPIESKPVLLRGMTPNWDLVHSQGSAIPQVLESEMVADFPTHNPPPAPACSVLRKRHIKGAEAPLHGAFAFMNMRCFTTPFSDESTCQETPLSPSGDGLKGENE